MDFALTTLADDVTVIRLEGRLNMVAAAQLRETVADAVARGRIRIVVDLAEVEFIDSSGLGALISGLKTARQAGGDLRISSPTEQVQLVLQLTNMERILTAYPSPEAAFSRG